jgi:hypothetical protein
MKYFKYGFEEIYSRNLPLLCQEIPQKEDISQASCTVHPHPERKKWTKEQSGWDLKI